MVSDPSSAVGAPIELAPLAAHPLVSLLVANYNYVSYIPKALDSALGQSYPGLEVVVCDDGSSDDSGDVIEAYARRDPRVRLYRKDNGGAASALNVAFSHSRGDIVCLFDADDIFERDKVARVVEAMRIQRCGVLVHPLLVIDGDGAVIQRKPAFGGFPERLDRRPGGARGGRWSYMEASAVCLRREVAEMMFPIPEDLFRTWADAYLCSLGALLTTVGYVDEALARYRIHTANVSGFGTFTEDHGAKAMDGFERLVEGVNRGLRAVRPYAPELRARQPHLSRSPTTKRAARPGDVSSADGADVAGVLPQGDARRHLRHGAQSIVGVLHGQSHRPAARSPGTVDV